MSGEDEFEIRIVCDKKAHPHHKGRDQHITALTPWGEDGARTWLLSSREIERREDPLDYYVIPGYRLTDEPKRRPPVHSREIPRTDQDRAKGVMRSVWRYELECPRCGAKAGAQEQTMRVLLDKLQAAGIRQVSLRDLHEYLDTTLQV